MIKIEKNTTSFFSSCHFLLSSVGFRNEFLLLTSSILSTEVEQNKQNDKGCAEYNGPGASVLFEVLNGPEEEPDKNSQHSKNNSKYKNYIVDDFFALEGVVVIGHWLPHWIGLAESPLILVSVENSLS